MMALSGLDFWQYYLFIVIASKMHMAVKMHGWMDDCEAEFRNI